MRTSDLDRPSFRERYPEAAVVNVLAKKSRRRQYLIEDGRRLLLVCVTDADSGANLIEEAMVGTLSRLGLPVAPIFDTFSDSRCRYLVQDYLEATSLDERLRTADKEGSFRLGSVMGALLHRLHSLPVSEFGGLPGPTSAWWDWIRGLRPGLPIPDDLLRSNPGTGFVHNDFLPHNVLLQGGSAGDVLALIDFEWSFLGDPMWDVGYLNWWLQTDDYPYPDECLSGVKAAYGHPVDEARGSFYASIRCPEPMTWWEEGLPPPVGWLHRGGKSSDTNAP